METYSIDYRSSVLGRNVPIRIIVPNGKNLACLFLLHGYGGNQNQWFEKSCIEKMAEKNKMVVVMPCCGNAYYEATQEDIPRFLGEELIAFARNNLPISHSKNDTYIAGVSMGGFGSLLVAAKYSSVFGKVASFSGAFIIHDVAIGNPGVLGNADINYFRSVFGDFSTLGGSSRDPTAEMIRSSKSENIPAILLLCGNEDVLYRANLGVVQALKANGISVEWHSSAGGHHWTLWNGMLPYVIRWFIDGIFPEIKVN